MSPVLEATRAQRADKQKELDEFLAAIEKRDDKTMTDDDETEFESRVKAIKKLDRQIEKLNDSEERAEKACEAAAELERQAAGLAGSYVRSEPHTYEEHDHRTSFLRDLATVSANAIGANVRGADAAQERLTRHSHELDVDLRKADSETRSRFGRFLDQYEGSYEARTNPNTTAGTGGEFVPPLWLVSQYAPLERAGRVIANRCKNMPLPPGIDVINVPRITTGSLTAIQTANAAAVTSQDIVTTSASANVNTIAGQEDISMQLLEQSPLAMDNVVFDDLTRDYDKQLDSQVISGSGSSGQHTGVLSVSGASSPTISQASQVTASSAVFFDGSTSGTQYRSIVKGVNQVETLRFDNPTAIWVHPRRANSWAYAADSATGRPLFVASKYGPYNAAGVNEGQPTFQGVAGELYGLPVVKDANMPTVMNVFATTGGTADCAVVVKEDDCWLWEGTMRMRALPEILSGTLQIRFQVYAYSAFMATRFPNSIAVIGGNTGFAAPGF